MHNLQANVDSAYTVTVDVDKTGTNTASLKECSGA